MITPIAAATTLGPSPSPAVGPPPPLSSSSRRWVKCRPPWLRAPSSLPAEAMTHGMPCSPERGIFAHRSARSQA
jgi:hypothetical protein